MTAVALASVHPFPAHRFEQRKKNDSDPKTWTVDFDETITAAPKQLARIATALKAIGDRIIVVTGNRSPRDQLIQRLADYGFPFDDLIQYEDNESSGLRRAAVLKQFDPFGAFDDRAGRAPTLTKVCPHFFVSAEPTGEIKDNAGDAKKDAKQAIADQT